ncbi:hypothetical protein QFZ77_001353 [Paenibacillus sp. V4I3]|nr:hypothetical protein [Paenibacillus sp. V4I3]MDQ0891423.1 hypothetical protein [Paenibacillus sp. V4I9]
MAGKQLAGSSSVAAKLQIKSLKELMVMDHLFSTFKKKGLNKKPRRHASYVSIFRQK